MGGYRGMFVSEIKTATMLLSCEKTENLEGT